MTTFDQLRQRNAAFVEKGVRQLAPVPPQTCIVCCLDPRTDPADILGLTMGDAMVLRNAGGRVTPGVIQDITFMGFAIEMGRPEGELFEVAVIHHTGCGTAMLSRPDVRERFGARSGLTDAAVQAMIVDDPERTVRHDTELLRSVGSISSRVRVTGHVYDLTTGHLSTVTE